MILNSCPVCGSGLSMVTHLSTGTVIKTDDKITLIETITCYAMSDDGIESTTTRAFPKGFQFIRPMKTPKIVVQQTSPKVDKLVSCKICPKEFKPTGLIIHIKRMHKDELVIA